MTLWSRTHEERKPLTKCTDCVLICHLAHMRTWVFAVSAVELQKQNAMAVDSKTSRVVDMWGQDQYTQFVGSLSPPFTHDYDAKCMSVMAMKAISIQYAYLVLQTTWAQQQRPHPEENLKNQVHTIGGAYTHRHMYLTYLWPAISSDILKELPSLLQWAKKDILRLNTILPETCRRSPLPVQVKACWRDLYRCPSWNQSQNYDWSYSTS